ncbi:MAG: hypothetical protein ACRESW_00775, partial [Nevskiales bacterium]
MIVKFFRCVGFMAAAAMLAGVAVSAEEQGALGIKLGPGSRLLLSMDSAVTYYDNYYYTPSNKESAIGLVVKPAAEVAVGRGQLNYSISAVADAAALNLEGDQDDYLDTALSGKFNWAPLTRHQFRGSIYRLDDHDPFGTRRTEGTASATARLDEWAQTGANLVYRFGAPQAKINLEGGIGTMDRSYSTNRSFTRFLDHDIDTLSGTVFYNVSSKTALVAEVIAADISYDDVAPGSISRAGDLTRYRVGAIWQATGNTSGDIRIGKVEREFDAAA